MAACIMATSTTELTLFIENAPSEVFAITFFVTRLIMFGYVMYSR